MKSRIKGTIKKTSQKKNPNQKLKSASNHQPINLQSDKFRNADNFGGKNFFPVKTSPQKLNQNRYFNEKPSHEGLRLQMVDWIKFICQKLSYQKKTLHFSISYMDAIFSLCKIKHQEFKLICFICIYIAAKLEERDKNIPYISVILKQFNDNFTEI